jgi:hypothetical protein
MVWVNPDGTADFTGIDWESHPITVWHRSKPRRDGPEYITFKIPSGKHWASYLVCEIDKVLVTPAEDSRGRERLAVDGLVELPLSRRGGGGS